ncbi:MAG: hypothetical protein L0H25_03500 [Micrococcales bacterium]|nr:hypothetical protein [Micrococcales bacterium]
MSSNRAQGHCALSLQFVKRRVDVGDTLDLLGVEHGKGTEALGLMDTDGPRLRFV